MWLDDIKLLTKLHSYEAVKRLAAKIDISGEPVLHAAC